MKKAGKTQELCPTYIAPNESQGKAYVLVECHEMSYALGIDEDF